MIEIIDAKANILVTGASGFVGQALCSEYVQSAQTVRALLRDPSRSEVLPKQTRTAAVIGDLLDPQSLVDACAGIDTILHLAGDAHVGSGNSSPHMHPTVVAAENLLAAALCPQNCIPQQQPRRGGREQRRRRDRLWQEQARRGGDIDSSA